MTNANDMELITEQWDLLASRVALSKPHDVVMNWDEYHISIFLPEDWVVTVTAERENVIPRWDIHGPNGRTPSDHVCVVAAWLWVTMRGVLAPYP